MQVHWPLPEGRWASIYLCRPSGTASRADGESTLQTPNFSEKHPFKPLHTLPFNKKGSTVFRCLTNGTVKAIDPRSKTAYLAWISIHRSTMLQVGRRRIDFVYEGRDSIEVKMPPPRHMREAALKASFPSLLPVLKQASILTNI